ncbi:imidazole glycerol phosphate synthase subunit HisH [Rhodospirillales bacterium]|nr:imidazole glycerol phosphate synthase subunit HisH [Rhodospirillales bacterium]
MKTVVLDYGVGNIGSVVSAFNRIGVSSIVSNSTEGIKDATCLVLPGVGNHIFARKALTDANLLGLLMQKITIEKVPLLGICLGMHMLAKESEEGDAEGLNVLPGKVIKFDKNKMSGYRLPHIGWNNVSVNGQDPLTENLHEQNFYFLHSFHFNSPLKPLATVHYGYDIPAILRRDNIVGVQFHPERSGNSGLQFLNNFHRWACSYA